MKQSAVYLTGWLIPLVLFVESCREDEKKEDSAAARPLLIHAAEKIPPAKPSDLPVPPKPAEQKAAWPSVPAAPEPSPSTEAPVPASPLSFSNALTAVMDHYPQLRKQQAAIDEAKAGRSVALAGHYPRATLGEVFTRTDDPTGVFMAKLQEEQFKTSDFELDNLNHPEPWNNFRSFLRMEIPIFDSFQTIAAARTASHAFEAAREMGQFTRQESALVAIEAYLRALLAERQRKIARQIQAEDEHDLSEAEALVGQGLVLGADFYTARAMVERIHQSAYGLQANDIAAQAALGICMGKNPQERYALSGQIPAKPFIPQQTETWLAEALARRSDLAAAHAAVRAAESELGRERGRWLPSFAAFVEGDQDTHNFGNNGDNYTVGIRGSMDLFDPAMAGRIEGAKARLEKTKAEEEKLGDQVTQAVTAAVADHTALVQKWESARMAIHDAATSVELTGKLYHEGRKSIADLADARLLQLEAALNEPQLAYETALSHARLLFLSGQLEGKNLAEIQGLIEAK